MAVSRLQAWVTYVTCPGQVPLALVLSKSLRRTQTNRRLGVIVSNSLSPEDLTALGLWFDDIFPLKDTKPNNVKDLWATILTVPLGFFKKIVLLEPGCMFMENSDEIFDLGQEKVGKPQQDWKDHNDNFSGDFYLINPSLQISANLAGKYDNMEGTKNLSFKDFIRNPGWSVLNMAEHPSWKELVAQLSLKSGQLVDRANWSPPKILQLVERPENPADFLDAVKKLLERESPGLTEQTMIQTWLEIFAELANPELPPLLKYEANEPIAIVGMSCRLPGANNLEEFWNLLKNGKSAIRSPPAFRWNKDQVVVPVGDPEQQAQAGFLASPVDKFDAKFFGLSPKEAVFLDPQTRLMLEVLWESLESAGIDPFTLQGSLTGIYTGSWLNDYRDIVVQSGQKRDFFRTYMGSGIGAAAARLSFLLGATGPCVATESGCSSSIVAVDLAVDSLRSGKTNLALAGGVNLLLHPFNSQVMNYVIAPDGRCKTFDAKADGFGRAEGCGFLVLKRLSDALRGGDHIWAMIRGSAVSQEGVSRSLGTPTVHCEAQAMELALKNGGVRPEQVSFVETHGTGTAVGDPMEVASIAKAYGSKNRKEPLVIGSVKTNVGHTESCSGITGIIKTVLALEHELIPRHLNLEVLNPNINLEAIPAHIPLEPVRWPRIEGAPRLAGVSSFGITGTDGHVILEEAPRKPRSQWTMRLERPQHLLKLSAKSEEALNELVGKYQEWAAKYPDSWKDACFTANTGRANFPHRAFLVAGDAPSAQKILAAGHVTRGQVEDTAGAAELCFLFTGQGSQYPGMGRTLYETSPVFRFHFDQCDAYLRKEYGVNLKRGLWNDDIAKSQISRTIYSQTGIFVVEYCLLKLWKSWGVQPSVALGHSLGEYCAAVCAGLLTFPQALKLVAERSRLIDALPPGSMLVVKANLNQVQEIIDHVNVNVDIAALNSDEQTVVAGDSDQIQKLLTACEAKGIKGLILDAKHAFHSAHMDPILPTLETIAQEMEFAQGGNSCKFLSGMEGALRDKVDAPYWIRHTRDPVNFLGACQTLKNLGIQNFVEVGPQPVLSSFVMASLGPVTCCPSLRKRTGEWDTILSSLGNLWINGYPVDWPGFDKPYARQKMADLPHYPFQRKTFWVDCGEPVLLPLHPLIGTPLPAASSIVSIYQNEVSVDNLPYLKDHCVGSRILFPGAAFTEMCLAAGYAVSHCLKEKLELLRQPMALENVRIAAPLEIKEGKGTRVQVVVNLPDHSGDTGFKCEVFHRSKMETEENDGSRWVAHVSAHFHPVVEHSTLWEPERVKELISSREAVNMTAFYQRIDGVGLKFGESFRSLTRSWSAPQDNLGIDQVVGQVPLPENVEQYLLHPVLLDALFQTQILAQLRSRRSECLRVPVKIGRLVVHSTLRTATAGTTVYTHAFWTEKGRCTLSLCTADFQLLAQMEDVELLETNVKTIESLLKGQHRPLPDCWEETWKVVPGGPNAHRVSLGSVLVPAYACPQLNAQLEQVTAAEKATDPREQEDVARLVTLYAYRALLQLGWRPAVGETLTAAELSAQLGICTPHLQQLVQFYLTAFKDELNLMVEEGITWRVTHIKYGTVEQVNQELAPVLQRLLSSLRTAAVTQIYQNLGDHLASVLVGEVSGLSLLFPGDVEKQHLSAEYYYQNYPARQECVQKVKLNFRALCARLKEASGEKAVLRVLEVGAGTGTLSLGALETLRAEWDTNFIYYYTDISGSFFVKAEKRVEEYADQVKFAVFNIEESPLTQGIPVNYFDVVVGADVLHATRDLRECVANLRLMLRADGLFFFTETVVPDPGITSVFGLLEGYWRFQDRDLRPSHACVSNPIWKIVLQESDFAEVHFTPFYEGSFSIITAEASNLSGQQFWEGLGQQPKGETAGHWKLFLQKEHDMLRNVGRILSRAGHHVDLCYPPEPSELDEWRPEYRESNITGLIYAWGMTSGKSQKEMALPLLHLAKFMVGQEKPPRLYIITRNVHAGVADADPSGATLWGMAKSLKNERPDLFVRCVDLGSSCQEAEDEVVYELALARESQELRRTQVLYRGGERWEPKFCKVHIAPESTRDLQLPPSTNRYCLALPSTRLISDVAFTALPMIALQEGQVEVHVRVYSLNFRDILVILKPTEEFERINIIGFDYAGVVSRVTPEEGKWRVGDRVLGVNPYGTLHSHLTLSAEGLVRIPAHLSFNEACTLPAVYATSIYCLMTVAQLRRGETVFIHTGSGGVGLSAIQVATHLGAKIITTAGSAKKRAYLRRNFGLNHVFHSRNTNFEAEVWRVTGGKGVDVVLNSITGPGFKEATLRCCAPGARFVEMSKLSVWTEHEVRERRADVKYSVVDLSALDMAVWKEMLAKITELVENGTVKPIPYVHFDAQRLRQALQFFQQAKHIGKVIVTMPHVTLDKGRWTVMPRLFDSESTYLITGGLGGIGFQVCKWMLGKGATNVVLTGRREPIPEVLADIESLNQRSGISVWIMRADVGNAEECQELIKKIKATCGKPLRGVHHCAGVLRDNLYANQTWNDFEATFNPKVDGTWNLHRETLDCPLEQFVLYSSVTALTGSPGQPNHAAANCFEDAFAHYRHSLGLPATSINWGQWAQVGCAKDVNIAAVQPVGYQRMLRGLEEALRSHRVQTVFCQFENLSLVTSVMPSFKHYLDEKLLKTLNAEGNNSDLSTMIQSAKFWEQMDKAENEAQALDIVSSYLRWPDFPRLNRGHKNSSSTPHPRLSNTQAETV